MPRVLPQVIEDARASEINPPDPDTRLDRSDARVIEVGCLTPAHAHGKV